MMSRFLQVVSTAMSCCLNGSDLASAWLGSVSIKVGLSAQGYPFAAPSGIVDQSLRLPTAKDGASIVTNFDSFGTIGTEIDGSVWSVKTSSSCR